MYPRVETSARLSGNSADCQDFKRALRRRKKKDGKHETFRPHSSAFCYFARLRSNSSESAASMASSLVLASAFAAASPDLSAALSTANA